MNYPIVFKLLSIIMAAMVSAFVICIGVAFIYRPAEGVSDAFLGFGLSIAVAIAIGLVFYILGRSNNHKMFRKEALATVGLGWILASIVGAIPYYLILDIGLVDSIFESASGLTTTGASVLSNLDEIPRSLHIWRALSQWMGGLGVVVFFVTVLSFVGASAKVLFSRESSAQASDLETSRIQQGVWMLVQIYLGLSSLCALGYWFGGMTLYDAILHMMTTVSTGGFSNLDGSFGDFNSPLLEWMAVVFMALGGTSFIILIKLFQRDLSLFKKSTEVKAYYCIIIISVLAVFLFLWRDPSVHISIHDSLRSAAFQVVSIMTTTGYATRDFDQWLPVTHVLLIALMVVGGCTGSTAGGAKVIRFVIAAKVCRIQIEKAFRANVVRPIKVNGKTLSPDDIDTSLVYIVMLTLVVFLSMLVVSLLEPQISFEGSLSAMFASLFNIGPGLAEVGPTHNFDQFHDYTKLYLSFLMILGRLELYALLALFAPSLWKRF